MHQHHFGFLVSGTFLITAVAGGAKWLRAKDGSDYLIDPYCHLDWNGALLECASQNLSMVTLDSEEKHMALKDLLGHLAYSTKWIQHFGFWIGGHYIDLTGQGLYCWAATGKEFNYTYWSPDTINNDSDSNQCVYLMPLTYRYWVKVDCDRTDIGCLCEKGPRLLENIKVKDVGRLQALDTQLEGK